MSKQGTEAAAAAAAAAAISLHYERPKISIRPCLSPQMRVRWKKYATPKEDEPTERQFVTGIVHRRRRRRRRHRRRHRVVSHRCTFRRRVVVIQQQ